MITDGSVARRIRPLATPAGHRETGWLAVGALLASNRLRLRRRPHHPAADKPPKLEVWADRVLHEPRYGLAVIIGGGRHAGRRIPAGSASPRHREYPTAMQVVAVFVFCIIQFHAGDHPVRVLSDRARARRRATAIGLLGG
jgi:hypothetical protein